MRRAHQATRRGSLDTLNLDRGSARARRHAANRASAGNGVNRTFVSAAGSDSNNCANVLTPFRHLATAYAATAANGEIYVLDPANYGSLSASKIMAGHQHCPDRPDELLHFQLHRLG